MQLKDVHALQKVAIAEIRVRGNTLENKVKHLEKDINKIKAKIQITTQEARKQEASKQKLKNVINLVCSNLDDVEISQYMPSKDKVLRLGKIAADFRKKITKLEKQRRPSTPP